MAGIEQRDSFDDEFNQSQSISTGVIVAIVVVVVVVKLSILALICYLCRRRRSKRNAIAQQSTPQYYNTQAPVQNRSTDTAPPPYYANDYVSVGKTGAGDGGIGLSDMGAAHTAGHHPSAGHGV